MLTLEEIQQTGAVVNNIILQTFHITHVSQLVSDTHPVVIPGVCSDPESSKAAS